MFGTGQPTKDGFLTTLKHISDETQAKHIVWTNMRQVGNSTDKLDIFLLFFKINVLMLIIKIGGALMFN